jgi:hypothetical protein
MLTKKDKKAKKKENAEGNDESLDMNVFEKLIEGKHTKIATKSNDDLKSINDTYTFDYSMQDKMTNNSCEDNNYNNDYDEVAYPFSKRIKLKHEPEVAQENISVHYTADIILEIKNRDGTVVPMRALLDTGVGSRTWDRSKGKPGLVEKDLRSSGSSDLQPCKKEVLAIFNQSRVKTKKSSLLHLTSSE